MTDDTWDETSIASGFVAWYTEPRAYGSYTPLMEEEATRIFLDWLRKVKADTLREAAEEARYQLGTEASGHTSTYSVRKWLNERANQVQG